MTTEIQLWCTQRYHMRVTIERVNFFKLLAKLLWYLRSGNSHAGYLHNYDRNPVHPWYIFRVACILIGAGP